MLQNPDFPVDQCDNGLETTIWNETKQLLLFECRYAFDTIVKQLLLKLLHNCSKSIRIENKIIN